MTLIDLMNGYSRIYGEVVTARDVAKRHLRMRLFDGPVSAIKILRRAEIKGIRRATLRRAKKALGIVAKKDGPPNENGERTWRWHWIPEQEDGAREDGTPSDPNHPWNTGSME